MPALNGRREPEYEIINENDNFIKVLFRNESIGWIKKNDI